MAKREAEQLDLIDTDHPIDKQVKSIVKRIRELDRERGEAQEKADVQRKKLVDLLKENNVKSYQKGDIDLTLDNIDKVHIKRRKKNDGDTTDGEESDDNGEAT